jgi:hypothetical protein
VQLYIPVGVEDHAESQVLRIEVPRCGERWGNNNGKQAAVLHMSVLLPMSLQQEGIKSESEYIAKEKISQALASHLQGIARLKRLRVSMYSIGRKAWNTDGDILRSFRFWSAVLYPLSTVRNDRLSGGDIESARA